MLPTVDPLGAGLDHSAYLLNGELVVRFRRSSAGGRILAAPGGLFPAAADQAAAGQVVAAAGEVAAEARLLAFVGEISPISVPRPVFVDAGCMAYPRLPGVPLISADEVPESVGSRLGELLAALHALRPEEVADFADVDDAPPSEWLAEAVQLWPSVSLHVPVAYHPAVETFLAAPPPPPAATLVFSHQDLGIEHVLTDPATGTITGVIDWSDAAIGDPARDFGLILRDLGPAALTAALHSSDRASGTSRGDDAELIHRAEFYARCGLIADLAHGVTTGQPKYTTKSLTGLAWLFSH